MQVSLSRVARSLPGLLAIVVLTTLCASHPAFAQPSSTWVQLSPANSPSPRYGFVMVYDPVSQKTVLFGGWNGAKYLTDTWTFDGTNWTQVTTSSAPAGRAGASAAYDSKLKQVVLFGGFNRQYLNDTWLWNGATSTWTQANPAHQPVAVTLPMLYPDPLTGRVNEYGGYDGKFYQSMNYRWRKGDWKIFRPKQKPSARAASVIGTNPKLKQTVIFGGLADVNPVNTWTFNGHIWTQQSPATQPEQRLDVGTVYDPRFAGVVTFGGFTGQDNNDMWLWDGTNWTQLTPQQSPPPREQMGMVFDQLHQQTIVFGGLDGNTLLNDTWALQTQ